MFELIHDFFTMKSAAVRALRVGLVVTGMTLTQFPDLAHPAVGFVIGTLGAAITGRDKNGNGGGTEGIGRAIPVGPAVAL